MKDGRLSLRAREEDGRLRLGRLEADRAATLLDLERRRAAREVAGRVALADPLDGLVEDDPCPMLPRLALAGGKGRHPGHIDRVHAVTGAVVGNLLTNVLFGQSRTRHLKRLCGPSWKCQPKW